MKLPLLLTLALVITLSACSTAAMRRFEKIQPGQSKASVLELMGNPDLFRQEGDQTLMVWRVDWAMGCGVFISQEGLVTGKECRGADAPSPQVMMPRAPANRPMQTYQAPRQTQTRCTSTGAGNSIQTNCTSQPSGIDTSIYH